MHSTSFLSALTLLVSTAEAGSRLWEMSPVTSQINGILHDKRALSIKPSQDPSKDKKATLLWPDKTLTYAYADDEAAEKLSPIFYQARQYWSLLTVKGFKYNEITLRKCRLYRPDCLLIHYNDRGDLSSTVGIPALEPGDEGPVMHLSDNPNVGNLDVNLNAAHELGHAWGLYHEHQNLHHWNIDKHDSTWPYRHDINGNVFGSHTFNCKNLVDYEQALARAKTEMDKVRMCTSQITAESINFSGKEWLPMKVERLYWVSDFDPESLMLYASVSGGKGGVVGNEDNRQPVLTYTNGKLIPFRTAPSTADLNRLIEIYGAEYKGVSKLLNEKDSTMRRVFRKVRSTLSLRGGDTEDGTC